VRISAEKKCKKNKKNVVYCQKLGKNSNRQITTKADSLNMFSCNSSTTGSFVQGWVNVRTANYTVSQKLDPYKFLA